MIIKPNQLDEKIINEKNFFLLYGSNYGYKKDLINFFIKKNSECKIQRYEEENILKNKDIFFENILSQSFFDNEKLIIISRTSDKIFSFIEELIEKDLSDLKFILESESLNKKSKLRTLFEKNKNIISIPFYEDSHKELFNIAQNFLTKLKITFSPKMVNILIDRAQGDRNNILNELEKISNFIANKKKIDLSDLLKITNLIGDYKVGELVDNCLNKKNQTVMKILNENQLVQDEYLLVIKTFMLKLKRLIKLKKISEKEKNLLSAISSFRPPIFWKEKDLIAVQLKLWSLNQFNELLKKINKLELDIKKNNTLSDKILYDFLLNNFFQTNSKS